MLGGCRFLIAVLLAAALTGVAGPAPVARAAQTLSFTNNTDITIPGSGTGAATGAQGSVYPSEITVSGFAAGSVVSTVRVTLTGLTHTFPDDIDMLLVSPDGRKAVIFSDIGGEHNVSAVTITLDDASSNTLPPDDQLTSGTFDPRNNGLTGDEFPAPAPAPGTGVTFASFKGSTPNGVWKLFVTDDRADDTGLLSAWTLDITTNDPPAVTLPSATAVVIGGGPPVRIDPAATVTDGDSPNFNGGSVNLTAPTGGNFSSSDLFGIRNEGTGAGQIGVVGSIPGSGDVTFGGTTIGTFVVGVGTQLIIGLNSSATPAAVQALVRNLTFANVSTTPSTLPRTIRLVTSDGDGGATQVDKAVTVLAPPVAVADAFGVNSGATLTVPSGTGVLANDTDGDTPNGSLQAQVVATSQRGTLSLQANGGFTYTPNAGVTGTDTFTYRAVDPQGNTSGAATVTITVFAPPVAVADAHNVNSGATLTVPAATGVLANDTDADTPNGSLQAQVVANAQRGTLALQASGAFTYTPNPGVTGTDTFTYRAIDPQGNTSVAATVTITVFAPPIAVNDAYSVNNGATLTVPAATGVLANDTDADTPSGSLQAQIVANPQRGTLALQASGAFTYTPNPGVTGTDTFTYRVVDPQGNASAPATVTITFALAPGAVSPLAPVAVNETYSINNGATLTVPAATGVLANDTDADTPAGSLKAQVVANPQRGTLNLQESGAFTYTPNSSATGTDTFTYRVVDPQGNASAPATAAITVNQVACGPRPSVTVATTVSGGALQATVTANDVTGPTGNRLIELRFGQLQNGQVTVNGQSVASGQTVALPGGTTTTTFTVRRAASGQTTTVPLTVVDVCGAWPTFVGGGAGAGF